MLHLENFFEKSFALLLTTPKIFEIYDIRLIEIQFYGIITVMTNKC